MRSRHIAVAVLCGLTVASAQSPSTLVVGGYVGPAADGTVVSGAVWQVYAVTNSAQRATGSAGAPLVNAWVGDEGVQLGVLPAVGSEQMCVIAKEIGGGTLGHTGYYAVMSHVIAGRDPDEFNPVTLRKIPIPLVTASNVARLSWLGAVWDPSDTGAANVSGYVVCRGTDGIGFAPVSPLVTATNYTDAIPNDAEYFYALQLVFRGTPPVTSAIFSANSARVFKDSDSDGLPDYYELAGGLDPDSGSGTNGPAGDADGDTMSNFEEWIAGTAANDRDSYLFGKRVDNTGGITIRWDGVGGRSYFVSKVSSLDGSSWEPLCGPLPCAADGPMQCTDAAAVSSPATFYRIVARKD